MNHCYRDRTLQYCIGSLNKPQAQVEAISAFSYFQLTYSQEHNYWSVSQYLRKDTLNQPPRQFGLVRPGCKPMFGELNSYILRFGGK